jgi:tyrosyl-tRNA synthetase
MKRHLEKPEERIAQKALAKEFITDLHGQEEYIKALNMSEALFTDKIKTLKASDIIASIKDVPNFKFKGNESLLDLLVNNAICSSRREAREMLAAGAISINNEKHSDETEIITKDLAIDNQIILVKKGKKKYYIGYLE